MRRRNFIPLVGLVMFTGWSCSHSLNTINQKESENRIQQQNDGTVSLILEKAECYNDAVNPANNTADWNVVISQPGHYKVWLQSATSDTTALKNGNTVRISMLDDQLVANPSCDKVVKISDGLTHPYYRADSYMGSVYVSEPGEYNVQLISDKVLAGNSQSVKSIAEDIKLMSVMLTPVR